MKKYILLIVVFFIIFNAAFIPSNAADSENNVRPDTWVATDSLGRETPVYETTGELKSDKYVGIFYFLFLNSDQSAEIIDISKSYLRGGIEAVWEDMRINDGMFFFAEPYFGYYKNSDEWVYAKHAQLLYDAGVDFIFIDVTNGVGDTPNDPGFFMEAWTTLCEVWSDIRANGGNTPQIAFHCGKFENTGKAHSQWLWDYVYKDGKFKDLWFYWDGKPLILGNFSTAADEIKNFFTIRESWAFNSFTEGGDGKSKWPWIAQYPQVPGTDENGKPEQVSVCAGFHANSSKGRSFHKDKNPTTGRLDFGFGLEETNYGLNFEEQWSRVFEIDPEIVMITGWNEFNAGRWIDPNANNQTICNTYQVDISDDQFKYVYVDLFSPEYSRDIEPLKGFYKDNYYYQMVNNIRKYKGVRKIEQGTGSKNINMSGDFEEFDNIGPVFSDSVYDIQHRNHESVGSVLHYTNNTGRNDISTAKVSKVGDYTYFYLNCVDDIVVDDGSNWMNLYIDSDQYYYTGWEGYDFVINRSRTDGKVSVEKFVDNSWEFKNVGEAEYTLNGSELVIKVKSEIIALNSRDNFDFKWADNSTVNGEIMEFMDLGDTAPNSRFNFRYVKENGNISDSILPGGRTPGPYSTAAQEAKGDYNIILIVSIVIGVLMIGGISSFVIIKKKKGNLNKENSAEKEEILENEDSNLNKE